MSDDLVIQDRTTFRSMWPLLDTEGEPLNTAGWTASAQIRASASASEVLATFEVTLATGRIELKLPAAARPWERGVYDVQLTSPEGEITRPISGSVWIRPTVTR